MPELNRMNSRCCGKQAGKRRVLSNLKNDVTMGTQDASMVANDNAVPVSCGNGLRNGCGNGKRNGRRNGNRYGATPQAKQ